MTERLPLFFLLASHLFVSGVLTTSILSIENKCKNTIWPVLYSWRSPEVSTTGFALKSGETRDINTPSSWDGLISARTLCSNSTGNFTCVTGDCESGQIECNVSSYGWSSVTYVYIKITDGGTNTYKISLKYGYNLPVTVSPSPSQSTSGTCMSSSCMVDLNKTCPDNLKKFSGGTLIACASACRESGSYEDCCTGSFNSKETCKPSLYVQNFERDCPSAYTYAFGDNNSTFTCSNPTDYVITFCPSSIPNITRTKRNGQQNPDGSITGTKGNSQRKLKAILGGLAAVVVLIIIVVIAAVVRAKNARKKSVYNDENSQMRRKKKRQSYIPMISESISGESPPMDGKVKQPNIQVFINFRGDELRTNFVGHLVDALRRSEINVFIDNQELRSEDLTILFKRIKDSGIAIAVFSRRYTESKWCLEELVKIKERADKDLLKVLPIFYKVTPENVKRLKGEFGDHFRDKEHMYASDKHKIKQWKDAICSVSQKLGLVLDEKSVAAYWRVISLKLSSRRSWKYYKPFTQLKEANPLVNLCHAEKTTLKLNFDGKESLVMNFHPKFSKLIFIF